MPLAGWSRAGRVLAQALAVCLPQCQQAVAGSIMTSTAWLLRQHWLCRFAELSASTACPVVPAALLLCRLAYGLQELDFSNNPGLTGMLPPQMGLLARLKQIRASDTNMSCAGIISPYVVTTNNSCTDPKRCTTPVMLGSPDTRYQPCTEETLLPCFLRFSEYMIPRDDDSNMRCKYILRRPVADAREACGSDQDTGLGTQAAQLPELGSDRLGQIWQVGPSYFQFRVCECLLVRGPTSRRWLLPGSPFLSCSQLPASWVVEGFGTEMQSQDSASPHNGTWAGTTTDTPRNAM